MSVAAPDLAGHFLPGAAGPLAVTTVVPGSGALHRFSVLYVPPFADEMNKSRRMAALQAREFARMGGMVALLDPRGTGDSAGDHACATWEGWHEDVACAWAWLTQQSAAPCLLWGLRLGALLALDVAARGRVTPAALLLWHPTTSGRAYVNQVLRLATVQGRLSEGHAADGKALRAALAAGHSVEVAGYELDPALLAGAESVELAALAPPACPVVWRDVGGDAPGPSPATQRVMTAWAGAGIELDVVAVRGAQFWATQEIAENADLLAATTPAVDACLSRLSAMPA